MSNPSARELIDAKMEEKRKERAKTLAGLGLATELPTEKEELESFEETQKKLSSSNQKEIERLEELGERQTVGPDAQEEKPEAGNGTEAPKKEIDENIVRELKARLDEARMAYVQKDIEAEKKSGALWKILRVGSLGNYTQEHDMAKNEYYAALKEYKDEMLAGGDVEKAVRILNMEERLDRDSLRCDLEMQNAGLGKRVAAKYQKMIEKYKAIGQNDKSKAVKIGKKLLAAGAVGVVAGGIAMSGGMVAGAAGTLAGATVARLFSSSISAFGFKAMLEDLAEKGKEKKSREEAAGLIFKNTNEARELDFDAIRRALDAKIEDIDKKMQEQKQWQRRRYFASFAAALAFSYAGQYIGEKAIHGLHEAFGQHNIDVVPGHGAVGDPSVHKFAGPESGKGAFTNYDSVKSALPVEAVPKAEHIINLDSIKTGGSIEGSIKHYLENNPKLVGQYNQMHPGHKFDAGKIAHRMFLELKPEDQKDLIHAGAQVHLTSDGLHIQSVTGDAHTGHLPVHEASLHAHASDLQSTGTGHENLPRGHWAVRKHLEANVDNASDVSDNAYGNFMHDNQNMLLDAKAELSRLNRDLMFEQIGHEGIGSVPLENTVAGQEHINAVREAITKEFSKVMRSFFGEYSDPAILKMNAGEYVKSHLGDKSVKIFKGLKATLTPEQIKKFRIDPVSGESVKTWSTRIVTVLLKNIKK